MTKPIRLHVSVMKCCLIIFTVAVLLGLLKEYTDMKKRSRAYKEKAEYYAQQKSGYAAIAANSREAMRAFEELTSVSDKDLGLMQKDRLETVRRMKVRYENNARVASIAARLANNCYLMEEKYQKAASNPWKGVPSDSGDAEAPADLAELDRLVERQRVLLMSE